MKQSIPNTSFFYILANNNKFWIILSFVLLLPYISVSYVNGTNYLTNNQVSSLRQNTSNPQVGTTAGSFNISATGGATYTVPITVPPGPGGLQPSLAITYNSQARNGLLGMGMNLTGISVITRAPSTVYYDGQAKPIQVSTSDNYAIDGTRLLLTSGSAGTTGAVYSTASETFSRVTIKDVTSYGAKWFELTTKEGVTYRYGSGSGTLNDPTNPNVIVAWYLDYVQDANGNYMQYNYQRNGNVLYLNNISYGGNVNTGVSSPFCVQFTYDTRQDTVKTHFQSIGYHAATPSSTRTSSYYYNYNLPCNITSLLTKCVISGNGNILRTYECQYTYDAYSRLAAVSEKGIGGAQYYPVLFNWNTTGDMSSIQDKSVALSSSNISGDVTFFSADLNGDGLDDLVTVQNVTDNSGVTRSNGCVHTANLSNGNVTFNLTASIKLLATANSSILRSSQGSPLTGDLTGTGIKRLFFPMFVSSSGINYVNQYWISSNAITSDNNGQYNISCGSQCPLMAIADINQDGKDELIFLEKDGTTDRASGGKYTYQLAFYNGTQWVKQSFVWTSQPSQLYVADFNGDGFPDICVLGGASSGTRIGGCYAILLNQGGASLTALYPTSPQIAYSTFNAGDYMVRMGDFNGDGFPDFLLYKYASSTWYLALNDGQGKFSVKTVNLQGRKNDLTTTKDDDKFNFYVNDIDGDGKSDVIVTSASYGYPNDYFIKFTTDWFTSTGTDFVLQQSTSTSQDNTWSNLITMGDFNGDGRQELFARGYDLFSGSGTLDNRIYDNMKINTRPLSSVTNGLNAVTSFSYTSLSDPSIYTKGSGSVYPVVDISPALMAVSSAVVSGISTATTQFSYGGARMHLQKGFLGFASTCASQVEMGVSTKTATSLNTTWYVPATVTGQTVYTDGTVASSTSSFNYTDLGSKRYLQLPATKTDQDIYGNTVSTSYIYDGNGNLSSENASFGGGFYKQTSYANYTAAGSYMPNKPQQITITSKHPDDANTFVTQTTYTYDASHGYVTGKTDNAQASDKQVVTKYSNFDGWGNPQSVTIAPAGLSANTETFQYDATGRFVTKHSTLLSSITTTYDLWGNTLSTTDDLNRTTTSSYDGLGRIASITYPDGRVKTMTFGWGTDTNLCWYRLTQLTGSPWTKTWYDNLGRETKTESVGMKGVSVTTSQGYNNKGQVTSKNWSKGNLSGVDVYQYDAQGRVIQDCNNSTGTTVYAYGNRTNSVTKDNKTTTKTVDAWGNPVTVTDPAGNTISYTYYSCGKPHTVTAPGNAQWSMVYDKVGNQTQLTDPNAGNITYQYNALGQLTGQVTPRNSTVIAYDTYDRIQSKIRNGSESTSYSYVPSGNGKGLLQNVTGPNGYQISYTYDLYDRLITEARQIDKESFSFSYGYDASGNQTTTTYPTGYVISRAYDSYGFLDNVSSVGTILWKQGDYLGTSSNGTLADGAMTIYTQRVSDGRLQVLNSQKGSSNLRNFVYDFSASTSNLSSRNDGVKGISDSFVYDNLERLTSVTGSNPQSIIYDSNGNITVKSNAGTYLYDAGLPHAVTKVQNYSNLIPAIAQSITYNSFDKVSGINEGVNQLNISYTPDEERAKNILFQSGVAQKTVIFDGDFEREAFASGTVRNLHYIALGNGVFAVMVRNAGTDSLYYVHPDHLGSYAVVTDAQGNVKERAAYDPWGLRTITEGKLIFSRGFTGHEHLNEFGLVNMNGRCYDPVLGRFLSPDPYIQAPDFSQSFNRYSYCVNNPLKYTDPNGKWALLDDAITMVVGAVTNTITNAGNIHSLGQGLSYFLTGAVAGEVSLYASPALGGAFLGGMNNLINQVSTKGWDNINGSELMFSATMGGMTAGFGQYISKSVTPFVGKFAVSLTDSPVFQQAFTQSITNAASGFSIGTGFSLLNGDKLSVALGKGGRGALSGFGIGVINGVAAGIRIADTYNENPWTGGAKRPDGAETFFENSKYSSKVQQQMSNPEDMVHSFPQSVDGFATKYGQWSTKIGADGNAYQWLEMNGSYGNKTGTFEYIQDSNGIINHRYFNINK
ncbi:RHS repeat-associated core domain-containing protein [Paludibacter sp.]|uniref:RHS repeat-associated core domain-containing protein n=1 Tax=Paludibacter sp. TaxID=1898105 RepID=UPI001355387A|nr:RHS repeat-associated core domain-containing protein [Paludibacter sp.]MTK52135.1 hypothetical protein [Paludibacter sp.]